MIASAISYNKTGYNWMPITPSNWQIKRAKSLFQERSLKGFLNEPLLAASQKQGVILKEMLEQRSMEAIQNFESFKLVEKDDFVISLRSFEGGIELAYFRGIISPVYSIFYFRENTQNRDFYKYLFKSRMFIQELNVYKKGIRDGQSISFSEFANIHLPVPPISEQDDIVQYIKAKEEKINRFIEKKQRFIELLKEQRQSVIHQVVTTGLNQEVKLKSSGIEWLGDIPTHWEIRRLKECLIGKLKYGANESGEEYNPSWYRYIRITDFSLDGKLSEENKLSLSPEIGAEYELQDGDILFARSGATVGKTFQFHYVGKEEKYCYAGYLIKATPDENIILSDFLLNYTNSKAFENWKNSIFNKATIENIGADKYSVLKIPIPPIEEQKQIVTHIKAETATIDTAITKAEREIELIKEYKEAMISEAVMGKENNLQLTKKILYGL